MSLRCAIDRRRERENLRFSSVSISFRSQWDLSEFSQQEELVAVGLLNILCADLRLALYSRIFLNFFAIIYYLVVLCFGE